MYNPGQPLLKEALPELASELYDLLIQLIYRNISDIGFASDIVVVTEEDVELYKDEETSIISPALKEGKVLYAA